MSKKKKFGPYMIKDGIVAKTRPWKKLNVPPMPEKLAIPSPDPLVSFEFENVEQENALMEKEWQNEVVIRPYHQVRRQYIRQTIKRPLTRVVKVAHQIQDFTGLVRRLYDHTREDG